VTIRGKELQELRSLKCVSETCSSCLMKSRNLYWESIIVHWMDVLKPVNLRNVVFWDVALCRSWVNRRSEERIASIFRVEKSASVEPA
jgi:hypothetical protein